MTQAEIITIVTRVVITILISFVFPTVKEWLQRKSDNEKLNHLKEWAKTAVSAAEQIYNDEVKLDPDGKERKHYAEVVINQMSQRVGLKMTPEEIDALIESAVKTINAETDNTAGSAA